jgi:cytochrome c peroxidase
VAFTEEERRAILSMSPLGPPPTDPTTAYAEDPAAARLGHRLFFETRLSSSGAHSCATCHDPAQHLADGRAVAEAIGTGNRHTPALWNVAHQRWFNWDGAADSLWSQALRAIENDHELGMTRTTLVRTIAGDASLRAAYESVFGPLPEVDGLPERAMPRPSDPTHADHVAWLGLSDGQRDAVNRVAANVGKALAAYQRLLVSNDSRFDRFVAGLRASDAEAMGALSADAQRGLRLFVGEANCIACHSGPLLSDGAFHSVRVAPRGGGTPMDSARFGGVRALRASPFNAAGPYSDDAASAAARRLEFLANTGENWGKFRTPSLRNAALTAPYMHAGQKPTLRAVLEHYSTFAEALPPGHHAPVDDFLQPLDLSESDLAALEAFLESLTDVSSVDARLLGPPGAASGR